VDPGRVSMQATCHERGRLDTDQHRRINATAMLQVKLDPFVVNIRIE